MKWYQVDANEIFAECKTRPEGLTVFEAEERLDPVRPKRPARGNWVEPSEDSLEKRTEQSSLITEERMIYLHFLTRRDTTSLLWSLVVRC